MNRHFGSALVLGAIASLSLGCGGGGGGSDVNTAPPPVGVNSYAVTPSAGANGTISPASVQTINRGTTAIFTVTPATGYTASVGGTCGGTLAGAVFTTSAIVADCTVVAAFAAVPGAGAATYYVAATGSDANSCVAAQSSGTPKQTIQAGLSCLAAGNTLIVRDGTYAGAANLISHPPSGSSGNYITIKAENEGSAILTAGLGLARASSYLIFQGLRFQDSNEKIVLGNHLKFFRNEFKGGCPTGNCANTTVGTNDFNDTADILFEDNWFHGNGGRYNLLVYNANRVVVRRGVIRHDAGWTDTKGDPEAALTFYNSSNCSAQNVLIVDSNLAYLSWQSAFYSVFNSASPNTNSNNSWLGIIALNNSPANSPDGAGLRFDGDSAQTNHVVQNAVLWDNNWGMNVAYASSVGIAASGLTVGKSVRGATGYGIAGGSAGTKTFTNVIVTNMNSTDLSGVSATYFDTYNNGSTSAGTGRVTYSPFANGLSYLTRIEAGSPLKTAGSGSGQIGAQIVNRIGTTGALQGEAGWNTETGTALWPFPNDARIKKEMCTDAGVTRGFCSSPSLTDYVMNYLGNGNPYP